MSVDITELQNFLPCPTPDAWIDWALQNPSIMLVDHANCEKKAASTALNMLYRYVDKDQLLHKLSRLAREELRHFEQVIAIMRKRDIAYQQLSAARYAAGLRLEVRGNEPGRLVDTLVVGAIIEARSCERVAALAPKLDAELSAFYLSLLKSEARHFKDYLGLAVAASSQAEVDGRLAVFLPLERELVESVDEEFRFHSGVPVKHQTT